MHHKCDCRFGRTVAVRPHRRPTAGSANTPARVLAYFGPVRNSSATLTGAASADETRHMSSQRDPWAPDPAAAPLAHPAIAVACAQLLAAVPGHRCGHTTTAAHWSPQLSRSTARSRCCCLRWGWRQRASPSWALPLHNRPGPINNGSNTCPPLNNDGSSALVARPWWEPQVSSHSGPSPAPSA